MVTVYHDKDVDIGFLGDTRIAVIGYGNQGRAQALNLRDSGLKVIVGVRADETHQQARDDGFDVFPIREAVSRARVLLLLIPDEVMPGAFAGEIVPGLSQGKAVCFASGYNIAFRLIEPPAGIDVIMVAPRMIGAGVRQRYLEGRGFPSFVGVHQDVTGAALLTALAIARGIGSTRSGALLLTFAEEAALDLFTEQAFGPAFSQVLMSAAMTLVDAGFPVEAVMMELILSGEFAFSMQKIAELGFLKQMELHSHTSQYGSMTRSARFKDRQVSQTMREILEGIRSGDFAREWKAEQEGGLVTFNQLKERGSRSRIVEWERRTREAFHMD